MLHTVYQISSHVLACVLPLLKEDSCIAMTSSIHSEVILPVESKVIISLPFPFIYHLTISDNSDVDFFNTSCEI